MRKSLKLLVLTLFVISLVFAFSIVASANGDLFKDGDNVFSSSEENELENRLISLSNKYNCDIVVVTVSSFKGYSEDWFAEKYYDENNYGRGSDRSGALLIFSETERRYGIVLNGNVNYAFSDSQFDSLMNKVESKFRNDDFFEGANVFIDIVEQRIDANENGFDSVKFWVGVRISVVTSVIIGIVAILVMRSQMNNAKPQKGASYYERPNSFKLNVSHDMYLYSTVRKRLKPQNNSSSSRSGGSRRSGGGRF